jgi:nucleoside-diphosphate-sugar epimerase
MPKIIITGACGFIGSNIAKRLMREGYKTTNVDNCSFGTSLNLPDAIIRNSDFNDLADAELNQHDILIHCATSNIIYAMDNPIETFQNNATNTIRLFQKFKGKIIYTSTASVYGQADIIPISEDLEIRTNNAYDQSKYIAELFLKQRGNYTTLRLSNVYGINQRADNPFCGVIGRLAHNIVSGKFVNINGNGTQTRDFTYIDDVVSAIVLAIEKDSCNTEINIASGEETDIIGLINIMKIVVKMDAIINYVEPRKIDDIKRRCLNIDKAKKILGWTPKIFIEEGISMTIERVKKSIL